LRWHWHSLELEKHVREQSSALGQWHCRSRPEQIGTVIQAGANKVAGQLDLVAHFDRCLALFCVRLFACARVGCGLGSGRICSVLFKSCSHKLVDFVIIALQHASPARNSMPITVTLTMRPLLFWREKFEIVSTRDILAFEVSSSLACEASSLLGLR
jgi:hypothetical protein